MTSSNRISLWAQTTAFLLILTELCWVIPWYLLVIQVSQVASPWIAIPVLSGAILLSYLATWLTDAFDVLRKLQTGVLAALLIANLLLGVILLLENHGWEWIVRLANLDPGAILVIFALLWLWWRGVTLAREAIRPSNAWRRFEIGILLFIAYLLVAGRYGSRLVSLGWFVFFLFVGFLAVIAARVSYVSFTRGARKNPFDRRWVLGVAGTLGLVLILAMLVASLLTGQWSHLLEWLGEAALVIIGVVVLILSVPGLYLVSLLAKLEPFLRQVFEFMKQKLKLPATLTSPQAYPELEQSSWINTYLPMIIASVVFWGIVFIVVVFIILRVRRYVQKTRKESLDEAESLLQSGDLPKIIRKAFNDVLDGFRRRLRPIQQRLAAARIRAIYTHLMDLCAELGLPRPEARTPLEFLPGMEQLFTGFTSQLVLITQAYLRVRYGELPETQAEVDAVEVAWKQLVMEGERLKDQASGNP